MKFKGENKSFKLFSNKACKLKNVTNFVLPKQTCFREQDLRSSLVIDLTSYNNRVL